MAWTSWSLTGHTLRGIDTTGPRRLGIRQFCHSHLHAYRCKMCTDGDGTTRDTQLHVSTLAGSQRLCLYLCKFRCEHCYEDRDWSVQTTGVSQSAVLILLTLHGIGHGCSRGPRACFVLHSCSHSDLGGEDPGLMCMPPKTTELQRLVWTLLGSHGQVEKHLGSQTGMWTKNVEFLKIMGVSCRN